MPTWTIDPAHSEANFSVKHMMFSTVRGSFTEMSGSIQYDPANPAASTVEAVIQTASISTGVADRDNHLRSGDFFNAEVNPQITFTTTRFDLKDETSGTLVGDLTMAGVTKEVQISVQLLGSGTSPFGDQRAGFVGTAKLNREAFGLTWNQALEAGGVLVGKDIQIELNIQAVLITETETA